MSRLYPVLLAGGSGTRLWPVSRKRYPKQFASLTRAESLFQASARRLSELSDVAPIVMTADDFRFIVQEQLRECGVTAGHILIEPEGRNTAAATLAAALVVRRTDPEGLILVAPSDHSIPDDKTFRDTVLAAIPAAEGGSLVTFGISPTRAETGYGYLELAEGSRLATDRPYRLKAFVEKPDADRAAEMFESGGFLWNAGVFLMSVATVIREFETHAPDILEAVEASLELARCDLGFTRLDEDAWSAVRDISIDHAIMEKASDLCVMPFDGSWSDIGSWNTIWQEAAHDDSGNAVSPTAVAIDCRDSLLWSENGAVRLVGIGLDGLVAVATRDAVLVARADESQKVKEAVERLRDEGVAEADAFPTDHRPWGSFESLARGDRFQVKRIVVKPGGILSLQSHMHRAEHWIVVAGTAKVTVGDEVKLVSENQSIYVPLGEKHRMENPGKVPMVLIEVQTGTYLGEDDIIRYEDIYSRK